MGNHVDAFSLGPEFSNRFNVYSRWSPFINASCLSLRYSFYLPFTAQIGFKFREHPEHVQKRLAGRIAGVDWLFRGLQRRALCSQFPYDVLKVAYAPRQSVNPSDHEDVAGTDEIQKGSKFRPAIAGCPGDSFLPDNLASGFLQFGHLDGEVLVGG
jgi:hypothetical protein